MERFNIIVDCRLLLSPRLEELNLKIVVMFSPINQKKKYNSGAV